jgi:hypothetical protein
LALPELKSVGLLAAKKTPVAGGRLVPMHGKATCNGRPQPSIGPTNCPWLRELSLGWGKGIKDCINMHTFLLSLSQTYHSFFKVDDILTIWPAISGIIRVKTPIVSP